MSKAPQSLLACDRDALSALLAGHPWYGAELRLSTTSFGTHDSIAGKSTPINFAWALAGPLAACNELRAYVWGITSTALSSAMLLTQMLEGIRSNQ
jgi:hypothetical protein